jgi:hypothetical protein
MTNHNEKINLFNILQDNVKTSIERTNQIMKVFDIQKFAENNPELQKDFVKLKNDCEDLVERIEKEKDNWRFEE